MALHGGITVLVLDLLFGLPHITPIAGLGRGTRR
jgi:hypothetical protein